MNNLRKDKLNCLLNYVERKTAKKLDFIVHHSYLTVLDFFSITSSKRTTFLTLLQGMLLILLFLVLKTKFFNSLISNMTYLSNRIKLFSLNGGTSSFIYTLKK